MSRVELWCSLHTTENNSLSDELTLPSYTRVPITIAWDGKQFTNATPCTFGPAMEFWGQVRSVGIAPTKSGTTAFRLIDRLRQTICEGDILHLEAGALLFHHI